MFYNVHSMPARTQYNTDLETLRKEVEIQTLRGTGPGGQHRNKVESAVRVTHIPTGIVVLGTEHRSQHRNRELALRRLQQKLIERNKKRKPRTPTRPTRTAIARRLEKKRRQARKKALRRRMQIGTE